MDQPDEWYEINARARVLLGLAYDGADLVVLTHFANDDPAVVTAAIAGLHGVAPLAQSGIASPDEALGRLRVLLRTLTTRPTSSTESSTSPPAVAASRSVACSR